MAWTFFAGGSGREEDSRRPLAEWSSTCGVAAMALAMRLWFIAETRGVPWFRTPAPGFDVDLHWQAARELRHGMVPHFALTEMSAPMHAFVLALEQWLIGESALALRLVAVPVGVLAVAVVHRLALDATESRWAAVGVGLLAALLPSLVYFDTMLFKVSLEVFLLAMILSVVLALRRVSDDGRRVALGAALGLLLATLCLSQFSALVEMGTILLFLATDRGSTVRQRLATLVPAAALVAACLVAFAMRDRLSPSIAYTFLPQAGIHLREGFRPDRVGPSSVPGIGGTGRDHVFMARIQAEHDLGRALTPSMANAYHVRVALQSIADHPYLAARTVGAKACLFWNNAEAHVHGNSFGLLREVAWALRAPVGFGTLMVLGALGVVRLVELRELRILGLLCGLVAAVFAVNLLGQVTARYRLHAVVPLLVLSGYGIRLVVEQLSSRVLGRAWLPLTAAVAIAALAYSPVPPEVRAEPAPLEGLDALSLRAEARLAELSAIRDADEGDSLRRARLFVGLQRDSEAFATLATVVDSAGPIDLWAARTWLDYLLLLGEYDRARAFVDRMTRLDHDLGARLLYGREAPMQWVLDVLVLHRPSAGGH